MSLKKQVIIICIVWFSIISFFIIKNEIILHTGKEVFLKTVPVDPKDILMGDYIILNYEISNLPINYRYNKNDNVYVILKTDKNNIASIESIQNKKTNNNKLFIKGKISKCNGFIPFLNNRTCIKYGIESYYVKEHKGKHFEQKLRKGTLVKIKIDKNGIAKIKEIKE